MAQTSRKTIGLATARGWASLIVVGLAPMLVAEQVEEIRSGVLSTSSGSIQSTQTEAKRWELSSLEWRRYQELARGIRKFVSAPTISPLEVLGIHARTETERTRYAQMWARETYEDTKRVLAFQKAYDAAMHELVGDQPLIDLSSLPPPVTAEFQIASSERFLVFLKTDCAMCADALSYVLAVNSELVPVEVFFVESGAPVDDHQVTQWLSESRFDHRQLTQYNVRVNLDNGLLKQLFPRVRTLPLTLTQRGDSIQILNTVSDGQ